MSEIKLNTIEEAIEDFREGKFLIVVDDEDRENEGDFIIAAEKITPEKVNFMLKNGRGVLCAPITEERCQELELDMQVANNTSLLGTPFTITVDKLGGGCTTGVSMFAPTDRGRQEVRYQNHLYQRSDFISFENRIDRRKWRRS